MKNFLNLIALATVLVLTSCGGGTTKQADVTGDKAKETTDVVDKATAKEYASAYICPMHCEGSGAEAAGKCPKCDMDYEKNAKHASHAEVAKQDSTAKDSTKADEHNHDHDHNHEGHKH